MSGNTPEWNEVVRWVGKVTGLPTIKDRPEAPPPGPNYISVNQISFERVGPFDRSVQRGSEVVDEQTVATASPIFEIEWMFSIHANCADFGMGSAALLKISSCVNLPEVQEPMWPELRVHRTSPVRNIPTIRNERWERNSQLDLFVRGMSNNKFNSYLIEQFEFDFERT